MQTTTYTKGGNKATSTVRLSKAVFGVEAKNHELLKAAYLAYLANGRPNLAKTLKRGEVRGGGRKPWRQKGTGRARFGSIRVPLWRGGGITFGPSGEENYSQKLTSSSKRTALKQALSLAAGEDRLKIIETFEAKDGKVKPVAQLFKKIGAQNNILLVVSLKDDLVQKATRNLRSVKVVQASYLNVYDVMNADTVIISQPGLAAIEKWLGA